MQVSHHATRLPPALPVDDYKTYAIRSPSDLTIKVACHLAGCDHWRIGWESIFDESTDLGQRQADYVRRRSGRTFSEYRTEAGLTVFRFASGQRCFREHHTRRERFIVRGGDWRGNPRGDRREHARPADWVEDFAGHQDRLKTLIERG
jgi:hypothetical protein